ncbi:MAG: hypothetical protein FWE63_07250 [Bacteroidales bacterium]|nr:hypothetical protein [Bacteroidales bacterium]
MRISKFILNIVLGLCLFYSQANAQISTREVPPGFKYDFGKEQMPVMIMPAIDILKLQAEDKEDEQLGIPPRFGFRHSVNINLLDAGYWHTLENGDKLCQLTIVCPDALSINLLYDKFWLPEGAKFFIYSQSKRHHIGAFTDFNNKGTKDAATGFATGLVYGNTVVLEYYQPKDCTEKAIISISGIVHGYRYILPKYGYGTVPGNDSIFNIGFNQSCKYQVNINCSEGNNWQNEKRAVALILVNGVRNCTGALINNTHTKFHPYFLTAHHCLWGSEDAIHNPNLDHWMFYWNYELPPNPNDCNDTNSTPIEPLAFSTSGAKVLANNNEIISDFALLELTQDPMYFTNHTPSYFPYYLGWDRTGDPGTGGVGIHHPNGDVKKIATHNQTPQSYSTSGSGPNYWMLYWMQTQNGHSITEKGSSGSPLINSSRHIIGQLRGSDGGNCSNPADKYSYYGKFSVSWTGSSNPNTPHWDYRRRLNYWLDPNNTAYILDGLDACETTNFTSPTVNTNDIVTGCNINAQNVTVQSGATLTLKATNNINLQSVIIKPGSKLILQANEKIVFGPGFKVELGGKMEIIK